MNGTEMCGCCAGVGQETPAAIDNRPGLSEIEYRAGTWAEFKASMLAALAAPSPGWLDPWPLDALKTRDDDDFTIALCDAFAVVCDILTFYYERSANEHYLRTATRLVSIAELAALIGYEPSPGVAASAALAFTLESPPPALPTKPQPPQPALIPSEISLAAGLQVQSVPGPGEQPVTFETVAPITARYAWNALLPRLTVPYANAQGNCFPTHLRLQGLIGTLQTGDFVLIVVSVSGSTSTGLNRVTSLRQDSASQTTLVTFEAISNSSQTPVLELGPLASGSQLSGSPTAATISNQVVGVTWSDQVDFVAQAQKLQWDLAATQDLINAVKAQASLPPPFQVLKLGVRASAFGHNAPSYATLPKTITSDPNFPGDWDNDTLGDINPDPSQANVQLDSTYPALVSDSWIVLEDNGWLAAQATAVRTLSVAQFLLASTVTQITLGIDPFALYNFGMRTATVLGATEAFALAEEFLDGTTIGGSRVILDSAQLGLAVGQELIVTGTSNTKTGSVANELHTIQALALVDGRTQITLDSALADSYVWNSVTINANVAPATEGTSRSQILGSGDATQAYQRFALNQLPLTYVSAATPSTIASTLKIRVNGELWTEVPYLYGHAPTERVYVTNVDQNGNRYAEFGDGAENGARLPTGTNNVIATYRQGLGSGGNVLANQLSTLLTRPLGLRTAINPLPASGGGDPQTESDARATAPITVRALDRIVSLDDFGDFASASAAVAKAGAVWAWDGVRQVVCITAAGPGGAAILAGTNAYDNLLAAIENASDGTVPATLCTFVPRTFTVSATLTVDPALDADQVVINAKAALREAFNFGARGFMQPVYRSEVIATIQDVRGVVALTLDSLAYNDNLIEPSLLGSDGLTAAPPALVAGRLTGAELLTIDDGPLPSVVHA